MLRFLQWLVAHPVLARVLGALSGSFNPWDPAVRRDPYPAYARLRAAPGLPNHRLLGGYVAARYATVSAMLRDPAFSTDRSAVPIVATLRRAALGTPALVSFLDNNLLMIDGARHRRLRSLVSKAFTPRRVDLLRPRIDAIVADLLDRAAARGDADIVRDLAQPLPAIVIAEMMGVPAADQERFRAWSNDLVEILDPLSGREGFEPPRRAMRALAAYFEPMLAERRRSPRDDLLSAMLAAEDAGDRLTGDELVALAALLLAAGHETTTNLIGNAVMLLLRHPGERRRLQDDLGLLPSAVEECLRVEPPVQLTDRAVVAPTELAGVPLQPGRLVVALLAAANRDPEQFPDPDRFDVGRTENDHLSFGYGTHFCLGASLARLETQIALGGLLRRFPDFHGSADPPGFKASVVLRGPTALGVVLRS